MTPAPRRLGPMSRRRVYQGAGLVRGYGMQRQGGARPVVEGAQDFASFYAAEHAPQVRRAFLLTGSNETANDVVHNAFVALYRGYADLEQPGAYLNRAVLNGCRDVARRRANGRRLVDRLAAVPRPAADHDVLGDALARLPFNQRAAVVLRFYGQLSHAEIAAALDCPIGSVGPWINRALVSLRKEFA